jgi:hypothetical protein
MDTHLRYWIVFFFSLCIIFVLISCRPDPNPIEPTQEPPAVVSDSSVEVSPSAKVLNTSTVNNLVSVSGDGSVLTFNAQNSQTITAGDIIVAGSIEKAPQGLLRKVTGVNTSGNEVTVTTTQATIEEAFKKATIKHTFPLKSDDISSSNLKKGVTLRKRTNGNKESYIDIDINNLQISDGVTVSGSVGFDMDFDLDLEVKWFTIKKASFIASTSYRSNLNFKTTADRKKVDDKIQIGSINFAPITIFFGALPVVFTIDLSLYVGMNGDFSAGIESGVIQDVQCKGGLEYQGGWHPVKEYTSDFDFTVPKLSSGCHITGYVGPELSLKIYGIAGPYAYIRGYIELDADNVNQIPYWGLYGGFVGGFGVKVEVFGHTFAAYEPRPIIKYGKQLASGHGNESSNWEIQSVDHTECGAKISIDLDANNYPYLCYQSGPVNNKFLRIAHLNGNIWEFEDIDKMWDLVDIQPKLQIDNNNDIHVVYLAQRTGSTNTAFPIFKYARKINGTWLYDTLIANNNAYVYANSNFSSILFFMGNDNVPHIFYMQYSMTDTNKLVYLTKNSSEWIYEKIDDRVGEMYDNDYYWDQLLSADMDRNNILHVFYPTGNNTVKSIEWKYATKGNGSWIKEKVPINNTQLIRHTSLRLDYDNNPHIAYSTLLDANLYLLNQNAGNWECETVDVGVGGGIGGVGGGGLFVDLSFDQNNRAHMAYYDCTNKKLKYARWLGEGWGIETVDQTADVGRYSTMILDNLGNAHIAYYDYTNKMVKYAKWNGPNN